MKKHLQVWAGVEPQKPEASLPTPSEVLYSAPNPNGTRKACINCVLYIPRTRVCAIHAANVGVHPNAVCGYHVFGEPNGNTLKRVNMLPVDPKTSGLVRTTGGTSCDSCAHYTPMGQTQGVCDAVRGFDAEEPQAHVESLGCCARWIDG